MAVADVVAGHELVCAPLLHLLHMLLNALVGTAIERLKHCGGLRWEFIHDEFPPETSAMLQALYSRSDKSVEQHVQKVQERGADKFMASYYVGYGHASIGDCGVTTLFVEDISILACKAIQDNALYSGQETSTRYIDFAGRRVHDPLGTPESAEIMGKWTEFYIAHT